MKRKHIIVTGLLGWLGGLGTAAFGTSCDAECPATPSANLVVSFVAPDGSVLAPTSVDKVQYSFLDESDDASDLTAPGEERNALCLDEGCTQWVASARGPGTFDIEGELCGKTYGKRVVVEASVDDCWSTTAYATIEVDPDACPQEMPIRDRPAKCDQGDHPSVIVNISKRVTDMVVPVTPREGVWFEHDGVRREADCINGPDGTCRGYIAGLELTGRILVGTDYCDQSFTEATSVELEADGCHVATEYLNIMVDTQGCLTDAPEGPDDLDLTNPEETPDDGLDVTDHGPDPDPPPPGNEPRSGMPTDGGNHGHGDPDPNGLPIKNPDQIDPDPAPPKNR